MLGVLYASIKRVLSVIMTVVCYRECVKCVICINDMSMCVLSVLMSVVCYRECVICINDMSMCVLSVMMSVV